MNYFEELLTTNVNDKVEKKNGLSFLPWAYILGEVKKRFPDMTFDVWRDGNGRPYIFDETLGYMVFTEVTIEGITTEMWLPVMDGANKAMKDKPYKYMAYNKKTQQYVEKTCEAATMFDINKTIMRCLAKNLSTASGLGLYLYCGDDIPETPPTTCSKCGEVIVAAGGATAEQLIAATTKKYGAPICKRCIDKQVALRKLEEQKEIPVEVVEDGNEGVTN